MHPFFSRGVNLPNSSEQSKNKKSPMNFQLSRLVGRDLAVQEIFSSGNAGPAVVLIQVRRAVGQWVKNGPKNLIGKRTNRQKPVVLRAFLSNP